MSVRRSVNDRPVRTALGRDGFGRVFPVSRETLERLDAYVALLAAWNRRINLVGASTMGDPWRRHILDSAQLWAHLPPKARVLVDLGSGAGLPGLILAILGVPQPTPMDGRVLTEAFVGAPPVTDAPEAQVITSDMKNAEYSWHQYLRVVKYGGAVYFDEGNGSYKLSQPQ